MAQKVWKHYDKFDKETGEWIGTGAIPIKEPDFIKIYITNLLEAMEGLEVSSEMTVFICICKYANYMAKGEVPTAVVGEYEILNDIAPKTKLSKSRIYEIIKILCEKDFIRRIGRARYLINPTYVAKGPWSEVNRMIITWERDRCDIRFE